MNYSSHYNLLINKAKNRILDENNYTETHHIIPKCVGGSDDKDNLCELTPEEHYVAHLLLVKIYQNEPKLVYAAIRMTHNNQKTMCRNNKIYGWLRRIHSKNVGLHFKQLWDNPEYRKKITISMKTSFNSAEYINNMSSRMKKYWENAPEQRKQQVKQIQKEYNKDLAEHNKKLWKTKEYREKMHKRKPRGSDGSKLKLLWDDPIWRANMIRKRNEAKQSKCK